MFVKICGITNLRDAKVALDYGADALGFVFYKKSSRYVTPEEVSSIMPSGKYYRIGVFADALTINSKPQELQRIFHKSHLNYVQLHDEDFYTEDFTPLCNLPCLKVIRARSREHLCKFFANTDSLPPFVLVDSYVESFGGMGVRTHLEWFRDLPTHRIILAGGIDREILPTVAEMGFFGVDVSSSVEKTRGIKDLNKMRDFLSYAKSL